MTENDKQKSELYSKAIQAVNYIRSQIQDATLQSPRVAIVCGSGQGGLVDMLESNTAVSISYSDIPNFAKTTVPGHAGKLVFGYNPKNKVPVVLLSGRAHFYEGHSMEMATFATRVCRLLDVQTLILTNAAGGVNPNLKVGDIVLINDHLNLPGLVGFNPLRGPNQDDFGVRFPPLSDAYDLGLRRMAHELWATIKRSNQSRVLQEGVYVFVSGPSYETRAECRMLHQLGADVVGMSTVPEVIVARHSGLRVLALSLVTNNVVLQNVPRGDDESIQSMTTQQLDDHLSSGKADHNEVLEAGREAAADLQTLILAIVSSL